MSKAVDSVDWKGQNPRSRHGDHGCALSHVSPGMELIIGRNSMKETFPKTQEPWTDSCHLCPAFTHHIAHSSTFRPAVKWAIFKDRTAKTTTWIRYPDLRICWSDSVPFSRIEPKEVSFPKVCGSSFLESSHLYQESTHTLTFRELNHWAFGLSHCLSHAELGSTLSSFLCFFFPLLFEGL